MSVRNDCVLTYHTNPATCGVSKFNHQLAERLGVPCLPLSETSVRYPLISIKTTEIASAGEDWYLHLPLWSPFDLFLHDRPTVGAEHIKRAQRVFYADEVGCPSTIQGNPTRAPLNVLTFGMAHKLQLPRYEKLKALLDATGYDYTISLSTAVHEGSPWDAVAQTGEQLRTVFGDKLRVLGYLADDALAFELKHCSAVALFFDPALRANNTTFWAVCDSSRMIVTNLDEHSPEGITDVVQDIDQMTQWRTVVTDPRGVAERYSWDKLVELIRD